MVSVLTWRPKINSEVASVCTDTFRFRLYDKAVLTNTLLFSAPQGFLISQYGVLFYQKTKFFLPGLRHFIFYLQSWIIKFEKNSCRISRIPLPPLAMFSLWSCKVAPGTLQVKEGANQLGIWICLTLIVHNCNNGYWKTANIWHKSTTSEF